MSGEKETAGEREPSADVQAAIDLLVGDCDSLIGVSREKIGNGFAHTRAVAGGVWLRLSRENDQTEFHVQLIGAGEAHRIVPATAENPGSVERYTVRADQKLGDPTPLSVDAVEAFRQTLKERTGS